MTASAQHNRERFADSARIIERPRLIKLLDEASARRPAARSGRLREDDARPPVGEDAAAAGLGLALPGAPRRRTLAQDFAAAIDAAGGEVVAPHRRAPQGADNPQRAARDLGRVLVDASRPRERSG